MAKITVPLLPQATEEYDQSQMAQLVQTLDQLILHLITLIRQSLLEMTMKQ